MNRRNVTKEKRKLRKVFVWAVFGWIGVLLGLAMLAETVNAGGDGSVSVKADEKADEKTDEKAEEKAGVNVEDNKYYLGTLVNTGKDNGYSGAYVIEKNDPHFGWELGKFYVSGYTRAVEHENQAENPVFLKNVGDTVALWFSLEQDIDCLNGDEALTIFADENGYDQYFAVPKTNFGRGTLIVRHIDYQNHAGEPAIYTNYLEAELTESADTKVEIFEEGDYEVALNYELKNDPRKIFGVSIVPTYTNYRIFLKFSVRNGNCMVFPFDTVTGQELTNASSTEHGFYLDLAKSRYLDIDIKKEILAEGADGLTEDVRFNRPAKDGDVYSDEGIYTITVRNRYTKQETVKKIYVGTNDVLKAHVVTGYSIQEIEACVAEGGVIEENGTLTRAEYRQDKQEKEPIWKVAVSMVLKAAAVLAGLLVCGVVFRFIVPRKP